MKQIRPSNLKSLIHSYPQNVVYINNYMVKNNIMYHCVHILIHLYTIWYRPIFHKIHAGIKKFDYPAKYAKSKA